MNLLLLLLITTIGNAAIGYWIGWTACKRHDQETVNKLYAQIEAHKGKMQKAVDANKL